MSAFTESASIAKPTRGTPCGVAIIIEQLAITDPDSLADLIAALALPKTAMQSEEIARRMYRLAKLNLIAKGIPGTTIARHRRSICGCGK